MAKKNSVSSSVMKRDTSKAGQVVNVEGMSVTYDKDGYAKSAKNDNGAAAAKYAASSRGSTSYGVPDTPVYGTSGSGSSSRSSGYGVPDTPVSATRTSSGGYGVPDTPVYGASGSGGSSYGSGKAPATSTTGGFHQEAIDAAARGDWDEVKRALADRQEKIYQQGGNDRGTSNQQILDRLMSQYGGSYDALSGGRKDKVDLSAGYSIPYGTYTGGAGEVYTDRGWQQGVNYLAEAQRLARAGDLEGAYDALMRRGFKLADGGSPSGGGGTSQDQAYAQIHQLYDQSDTARNNYLNAVDTNRQRIRDHQTQYGLETRPELANRRFLSTDGEFVIYYDANGTPSVAMPSHSSRVGGGSSYIKHTPEEIAVMAQYYNGDANTDFAELYRQMHNNNVVRTGVGRLIDQEGNYASGTPVQAAAAHDWTGLQQTDRYQDRAALQAILDQINAGQTFSGGSTQVPTDTREAYLSGLTPKGVTPRQYAYGGGGSYGGSGGYGYGGSDLTSYLQMMAQQDLQAQMAALQAAYQQNAAGLDLQRDELSEEYRAKRDQAAAQNDLQRMYLAEMGAVQGLNTGATGQLALAQGLALQNGLADLGAAESRDLARTGLAIAQLGTQYQGDLAAAQAQSRAQLAQNMYSELVRQANEAEARRQADLAQSNWERQFAYQQQQDALAYQSALAEAEAAAAKQSAGNAYNTAKLLLSAGVMPDAATLAAAGISQVDAQSYVTAMDQQQAAKQRTSGSGGGSKSTGDGGATGTGGVMSFADLKNTISRYLALGGRQRAQNILDQYWDGLTEAQQRELQRTFQ